jgi:adenine-specific DNA-methyltransferase
MELNSLDNGNRNFINIQIDEKIADGSEAFKNGYTSIFDITKNRLIKVEKV